MATREGTSHQRTHDSLAVIKIWSWAPDGRLTPRQAGWLTVGRDITLTLTEMAVRRVGSWCEVAVSLRGREPRSTGTSTIGRCYQAVQ
jgi:hypothetical protein